MAASALDTDLDRQIAATHARFVEAMAARLPSMETETKERYFGVLSTLVAKLEHEGKSLREVLNETMAEAAGAIMLELVR
ncbi:MAG TPA: hypothetical protein VNO26_16100 [Candidatus Limnocylindria bacterium]|nr:hypothetical protein [Candidatus Limnocylindria bacterium]